MWQIEAAVEKHERVTVSDTTDDIRCGHGMMSLRGHCALCCVVRHGRSGLRHLRGAVADGHSRTTGLRPCWVGQVRTMHDSRRR